MLKDFEDRCAYSLVHIEDCGKREMEVDHHNPTITGNKKHNYANLFPATRHCNGKKSDVWPTKAEQRKGLRFLNPRKEGDYGCQIFENEKGELVGVTPAARYHIEKLDLNAPHLTLRRNLRTEFNSKLRNYYIRVEQGSDFAEVEYLIKSIGKWLRIAIPFIPPPPPA